MLKAYICLLTTLDSKKMKCIIVDDDLISCRILQEFVEKTTDLELEGVYHSAVEIINSNVSIKDVGIIFLDVEMPYMTGFDYLNNMEFPPHIIIISGKENYAVEAFNFSVTDFLLKPITYARFLKAIKKIKPQADAHKVQIDSVIFDGVFLKRNNSYFKVKYDEIMWIEALENYVSIHTPCDKYVVHQTLKVVESKLPLNKFKRIHRSFIVNVDMIKSHEDNTLIVHRGKESVSLPVGKSFKVSLMKDINAL